MNEDSETELPDTDLLQQLNRLGAIQPDPEAMRRALEHVRTSASQPVNHRSIWSRKIMWRTLVATVASFFGIAVLLTVWLLLPPSTAQAGWSEVQAAMQSHKTVKCRQVVKEKGEPDDVSRCLIQGDGKYRIEQADGDYTIIDSVKHRALLVQVKARRATLMEGSRVPPANLYEVVKNLPNDTSARALPGKKIDGKDVLGFVVKHEGLEQTVWADSATRLPVLLESSDPKDKEAGVEMIIDQFEFDKELDPKLFAFDPPAGYQLTTIGSANFPDAPTDPKLKELVVTPLQGIGTVKFRASRADVEKLLGKPDSVNEPVPGGLQILSYGSRGLFLHVSPKMGLLLIMCVSEKVMATRVRDFSGKTDKGIGIGSSQAKVIEAYGEPTSQSDEDGTVSISYGRLNMQLTLFEGKVVQIMFNRPR